MIRENITPIISWNAEQMNVDAEKNKMSFTF